MAITKRIRVSFDLKMVIKEELMDAFSDCRFGGASNLRFEVKQ